MYVKSYYNLILNTAISVFDVQNAATRQLSLSLFPAARAQLTYCWGRSLAELVDWLASLSDAR